MSKWPTFKLKDEPVCVRELKPGVLREGHKLTDHVDYNKEPPPIPCLGHWNHTVDGSEYDCDYEHAGHFGCEDCIVNGGRFDPRKPPEDENE